MKKISVSHSPDADDIFMYYALYLGWVNTHGIKFSNTALDIETLNQEAIKGTYDISAISFGMYPYIRDEYALLKTAVSFGDGYGPKLIKLKNTKLRKKFSVALSGENTTNALLFKIAYPDAKIVYKNFLDIEASVLSGEVDAGVLIHESILNFDNSLVVERELWNVWYELGGDGLPLPLGGMALRRSFPLTKAIQYEKILTKAVEVATKNKHLLSKMLSERDLFRVDEKTLEKYLSLYANEESISMNEKQLNGVNHLFKLGFEHGFYDILMDVEDYLIPDRYNEARYN